MPYSTQPRIKEETRGGKQDLARSAPERVTHRILHPSVRDDDQIARKPRTQAHHEHGRAMALRTQTFFTEENSPRKSISRKNAKTPSIARVWPIISSGEVGELCPVGPELEFDRNSRHHSHGEIQAENSRPEAGGALETLVTRPQRPHLPDHDDQAPAPWSIAGTSNDR